MTKLSKVWQRNARDARGASGASGASAAILGLSPWAVYIFAIVAYLNGWY